MKKEEKKKETNEPQWWGGSAMERKQHYSERLFRVSLFLKALTRLSLFIILLPPQSASSGHDGIID